ncbi:MAG: S-layer homology domain-containing protein [Clostridia bacterium]|nr:S-layer homology domain-containing protein [Clostridia bacterium]
MKILTAFLTVTFLLCSHTAFSEENINVRLLASPATHTVRIRGEACTKTEKNIVLTVVYPGYDIDDKYVNINEAVNRIIPIKTEKNGLFEASYELSEDAPFGKYSVYINDGCGIYSHSACFDLKTSAEVKTCVDEFNSSVNELTLKKHSDVFGTDIIAEYNLFTEEQKNIVWEYMKLLKENEKGKAFSDNVSVSDAFYKAAAAVKMNYSDNAGETLEKVYKDLGFDISEYYNKLSDEYKNQFRQNVDIKNTDVLKMNDVLDRAVKVSYFNRSSRADIKDTIDMLCEEIGMDIKEGSDFRKCSNQADIYIALAKKDDFKSFEEIKDYFDSQVRNSLSKGSSGSNSQGGSSSSGGSGNKQTQNIEISIPPTTEIKDEIYFTDIDDVEWAKEAITSLYKKNIISGTGEKKFTPHNPVRREEFVKMLVNVFGVYDKEAQTEFTDVDKDSWYYSYIASAYKIGIVNGRENNTFGVGENITRQDMCVMLFRAAKALKVELKTGENVHFEDEEYISDYAKQAVTELSSAGIINGVENGYFDFDGTATRAMAAVVTDRIMKYR